MSLLILILSYTIQRESTRKRENEGVDAGGKSVFVVDDSRERIYLFINI